MSSGLAAVFIEAPEKMQEAVSAVPQVLRDHCDYWKMATEGNVVGKMSVTDLAGQPWGPFPLRMVSASKRMTSVGLTAQGWTPKAIGAMAGCIITALLGIATIVFYASHAANEEDLAEEMRCRAEKPKGHFWDRLRKRD